MTLETHPRWINCKDTAKAVRRAIKTQWPRVKFSVRSSVYSGGASIDVRWTDGPCADEVDVIIQPFAGAAFDGMIDMKVNGSAWLMPDGTAQFAATEGTTRSRGTIPEAVTDAPHPDAELVRFGADYIFGRRDVENYDAEMLSISGIANRRLILDNAGRFGMLSVRDLCNNVLHGRRENESREDAFARIVLR